MKARLKCENPDKIEYTMTMTMTAGDWEKLREQLQSKWPSYELTQTITDLLAQARKVYWPKEADEI